MRQIVLDTETTGLRHEDGHRVIEIGCVELINRQLTGVIYHQYVNPERAVDAGAFAVHGIGSDFLADKPVFKKVAADFMDFIAGAELIIHNAAFDVGFLNAELALLDGAGQSIEQTCTVTDSLAIARRTHPGQRNSLDALCTRYYIDRSHREYHGALLDAELLAQVYLLLTGGQGSLFAGDTKNHQAATVLAAGVKATEASLDLPQVMVSDDDQAAHQVWLTKLQQAAGQHYFTEDDAVSDA